MIATPKTTNRLVFCFVSTRCLVYYFLLFLDPNLTIAYLAMLAGLQSATVTDMFLEADDALFRKILYNKAHVLHSFWPVRQDIVYSLHAISHIIS